MEVLNLEKIRALLVRYREMLSYLFFGVLTTLVNMVAYALLSRTALSTGIATAIANAISILFAYVTNRIWVFESKTRGPAALKEFASFVSCRLATLVLDIVLMIVGVDWLGAKLIPAAWMDLWELTMKLISNVVIVVVNYIFSKLLIFRRK